jgi:D-alanyl-lipoteichoic acid acyltransferase DltB (MBOAT superfamily)
MSALAAWSGALSYALQLYFDFSGYSDMAIGLAAMMGIAFPINFNSPYKAASLIDFWRRWHMTLSRFLRDYLYIPLGGNRRGPIRRNLNLVITMVLGGLWHGPSWNFAAWGVIHGLGLLVNHAWQDIARRTGIRIPRPAAQFLTLLVVVLAWVPFRAETFKSSVLLWTGMFGLNAGQPMPSMPAAWSWIVLLGAVALLFPNTSEIFDRVAAASRRGESLRWAPTPAWAVALGAAFGIAFASSMFQPSAFLYFRF